VRYDTDSAIAARPPRGGGPFHDGPPADALEVHYPPIDVFGRAEARRAASAGARLGAEVVRALPRAVRRNRKVGAVASDAVVDAFERLGPTFVKLGQLIASSPGLFPETLAHACRRTLDKVPPVGVAYIRAVIEDDLGAPVEQLFATFDPYPLSAASIAQVHACTLPDGRAAVVKVQRPDISERMNTDLRILYRLAKVAARSKRLKMTNPVAVIEDLHRVTNEELNFAVEADRQARFRSTIDTFGDHPHVTTPEVYWERCGPRVICMERMWGMPVDRYERDRALGERLLRESVKAWLEAACLHGPFHGDLHAGNMWILDDGRISFLDFGIMGELAPEWREVLRDVFATIMLDGNYVRMVRDFKRLGVLDDALGSDETMAGAIEMIISPLLDSTITSVSLGDLLQLALTSLTQFGAIAPPELVLIAKQVLYVERYMAKLAPDWQLARDPSLLSNIFPDHPAIPAA
jgi:predicted unusual protein kinase regulating ubiquinone biosynthesis (AarF/ABC1/UbiB family)